MTHRMSSNILAKGIPGAKFVMLPKQKHNYFASDPSALPTFISVRVSALF
jgi:hypothetical protein